MAPGMLPIPPRITMHRMLMDSMKRKLSGKTDEDQAAETAPANPAVEAPMAKAKSYSRVVWMPMARAATSSSRMAAQARPIWELRIWYTKKVIQEAKKRMR